MINNNNNNRKSYSETNNSSSREAPRIADGVYSAKDMLSMDINLSWAVDGILPAGGLMILSGSYGIGKSFMALDLSIKTTQEPPRLWFDKFALKHGPVAYIDAENSLPLIKKRLQLLKSNKNDNLHFLCYPALDINNLEDVNRIANVLKKINPVLIVIDSLRRCHGVNETMREIWLV